MIIRLATLCLFLLLIVLPSHAQQIADPDFKATVEHPAFTKIFPRVLFDEAHNNFHTAAGRYKPFADLISNDGYHVVRGRKPFTKESLDTFKLLVIANALGAEEVDDEGADHSAFTDHECETVSEWVHGGGSLLLIAGRTPFAGAAENLAKRFNVNLSKGATRDPANQEKDSDGWIVYSRANKLLVENSINAGRNDAEKINRVIAFGGQSLKGPEDSVVFLKLADSAIDTSALGKDVSAAGRSQGIAMRFGKGRIVILSEADMLSALLGGRGGKDPVGMNYPDTDNQQLALNIVHWLSGLLK
jgi:hypothetical protein